MKRTVRFLTAFVLTTLGWGIAWGLLGPVRSYMMRLYGSVYADSAVRDVSPQAEFIRTFVPVFADEVASHALTWFLGGLFIGLALRITNRQVRWHHSFLIGLFWMLGSFLLRDIPFGPQVWSATTNSMIPLWIGLGISIGAIAAVSMTALVISHVRSDLPLWRITSVGVGWLIARAFVGINHIEIVLGEFAKRVFTGMVGEHSLALGALQLSVRGLAFGAVGAAIMWIALYLSRWGTEPSRAAPSGIWTLLGSKGVPPHLMGLPLRRRIARALTLASALAVSATALAFVVFVLMPDLLPRYTAYWFQMAVLYIVTVLGSSLLAAWCFEATRSWLGYEQHNLLALTMLRRDQLMIGVTRRVLLNFADLLAIEIGLLVIGALLTVGSVVWNTTPVISPLMRIPVIALTTGLIVLGAAGLNFLALVVGSILAQLYPRLDSGALLAAASVVAFGGCLIILILMSQTPRYFAAHYMATAAIFAISPYLAANEILRRVLLRTRLQEPDISQGELPD